MRASFAPMPRKELELRQNRCRELLAKLRPDAGGLLAFGRETLYYLGGAMGAGVLWLPLQGEPLLMVRKGIERVRLDSPSIAVAEYRSYGDLARVADEHGAPLTPVVAAEQSVLPWNLADTLQKRLFGVTFVSGDAAIMRARATKTAWELEKMRTAGELHAKGLEELLPAAISPGMTELEIAHTLVDIFFSLGSSGIMRMNAFGEELFVGQVCAGDNGNYPTCYNGPVGGRGMHPAVPYLGCQKTLWKEGDVLTIDAGFSFDGYMSDKTLCYFAGSKRDIPPKAQLAQDTCCAIEEEIARAMRPGAIPYELYERAVAMADKAGFAENFMGAGGNQVAFLGHGIGLCVDEWPVLAKRFDSPLESGMTLAIEPKIGLPGIGIVGTENTWEVTDSGGACLTGGPRDFVCVS